MTCHEFLHDLALIGPVCFLAGLATGYRIRNRILGDR